MNLQQRQREIRKQTEFLFNKRTQVKKYVPGKLYWILPNIGEYGWVHGRTVKAIDEDTLKHPETGEEFKNIIAVKSSR